MRRRLLGKCAAIAILALALGSVPYGAGARPAPASIAIPERTELERYIWEYPTTAHVDLAASAALRQELEQEVQSFLSTGQLAPWFLANGKTDIAILWVEPAETLYYLSLAYPYLTGGTQAQLRSYLSTEARRSDPLSGSYDWTRGARPFDPALRRENSPIGYFDYCLVLGGCEGFGSGNPGYIYEREAVDRLYDLWLYAYTTEDWNFIRERWDAIRASRATIDLGDPNSLLGIPVALNTFEALPTIINVSANRRVAALIGYARLARSVGDSAEAAWAVDAAARAMQERLRYVDNNRPVDVQPSCDGSDPANVWEGCDGQSGTFVVRRSQLSGLPQYRELRPEIGRLLATYAASDVQRFEAFVDKVKPTIHLMAGPNSLGGEVPFTLPVDVQGVFLSKALIANLPPDRLQFYLDQPWVRQDYFYYERLVRTIDSYGTDCQENLLTTQVECPR